MQEINLKEVDKKIIAGIIRDIVKIYFKNKVTDVKYLGESPFDMVFKVIQEVSPKTLIVKVYLKENMNIKEAFNLQTLSKNSNLKFPKVYFVYNKTRDLPLNCMCMEYIEGSSLCDSSTFLVTKKSKKNFAETIVNSMLEIHSCTNDKFGILGNTVYDSWIDYYKPYSEIVLKCAKELENDRKLNNEIIKTMEFAYSKFNDIFSEKVCQASLIHGSINDKNIMVKKLFKVSSILNPMRSMYADREYDLFQLYNTLGKDMDIYNLYKEKYPVSKNCDIKCAFYALWNEVDKIIKKEDNNVELVNSLAENMKEQLKNL